MAKLTGLSAAWFRVYEEARDAREEAFRQRGDFFGILAHDDRHALRYQLAYGRGARAARALRGYGLVSAAAIVCGVAVDRTASMQRQEFLSTTGYRKEAKRKLELLR